MIFKKNPSAEEYYEEDEEQESGYSEMSETDSHDDNIDTVVGPSMIVEGDFASEGNIVVKGTVTGSVCTSKNLTVEEGAKILANVKAGSANISGEVRGNIKIKDYLELNATAKVIGDVEAKTLAVEAGALMYGKIAMPGVDRSDAKNSKVARGRGKKGDKLSDETEIL